MIYQVDCHDEDIIIDVVNVDGGEKGIGNASFSYFIHACVLDILEGLKKVFFSYQC